MPAASPLDTANPLPARAREKVRALSRPAGVADRLPTKGPGKVTINENKLTLWLGTDHVPLAAEHIRQLKFSFLVFKSEQKSKRSWHYARSGDRLLRARYESNETTSGMGQKGNDVVVATLKVQG
jgi:hypothetical protein